MEGGGYNLSEYLSKNNKDHAKLNTAAFLLAMSEQKAKTFRDNYFKITQQIKEDREMHANLGDYYSLYASELSEGAEESITTSNEADESYNEWIKKEK